MTRPRTLLAIILPLVALALVAAACEDSGDFLFDEEPEATGTPTFLQRSPEPSPEPSPEASPLAEGATPVAAFTITVDETVNVREGPSTDDEVAASLESGDEATVVGTIRGEAVEEDNDVWYQLEDGTFVYSGAVQEMEE